MRRLRLFALVAALSPGLAFAAAAATPRVVSGDDLERWWRPLPEASAPPAYPVATAGQAPQACVSLGFVIGADGSTSTPVELESWREGSAARPPRAQIEAFVQAAARALSKWKFAPAGRARPVFTSATFAFDPRGDAGDALAERCRIHDLPRHLRKLAGEERKSSMRESEYRHEMSTTYGCTSFSSACVLER